MTSTSLRIFEIFHSLQGESSRVGLPTVFVRLTGCPLRCGYCDTAYAFQGGSTQTIEDILREVAQYQAQYVCVTGGEPLAQKVVGNFVDFVVACACESRPFGRRDDGAIERIVDAGFERGVKVRQLLDPWRGIALRIDRGIQSNDTRSQRAGLVGAKHIDAAEVFNGFQPPHDDAALRHRARAMRQRHAHNRGQQFR